MLTIVKIEHDQSYQEDVKLGHLTSTRVSSDVSSSMYGKVFKLGQSSMLSSRKDLKQLIPSGSEVKLGSHLQILRVSSYVRSIIQSGKLIKLGRYLMLSFSYLPLSYLVSISLLSFYYSSCYKKQVNLNLKRKCVPLF